VDRELIERTVASLHRREPTFIEEAAEELAAGA
jgi:hypothetical protein